MLGVGHRRRRRTSVAASRNWRLETRDDLGDVVAIELCDGGIEFGAFLAFNQKLCNFLTALYVFRPHLPDLPFLRGAFPFRV